MKKAKIVTVIGTRPEAIKLAPVILELQRRSERFQSVVCSTGQHREMLDQALQIFGIEPTHELGIMSPGQSLATVTARAVQGIDQVLEAERPDCVLVQGDTTTAMCGALAGHYRHVPVGHVEAGLRTGNKYAPFPEEMNRRLVGRLADLHFAPTQFARQVLLGEGVSEDQVILTGNTVIDALLWVRDRVADRQDLVQGAWVDAVGDRALVLVTGHRRESFGEGFENICRAIRHVADQFPEVHFIYPVHLNPRVQDPVNRLLGNHERIHLIPPMSYEPFVWLMNRATVVLTDSGGVQEEAPSLGKPVLVMRETTERPEGIEAGNARLVGVDFDAIVDNLNQLLSDSTARDQMASINNPYGDGTAAKKIVAALDSQLV